MGEETLKAVKSVLSAKQVARLDWLIANATTKLRSCESALLESLDNDDKSDPERAVVIVTDMIKKDLFDAQERLDLLKKLAGY